MKNDQIKDNVQLEEETSETASDKKELSEENAADGKKTTDDRVVIRPVKKKLPTWGKVLIGIGIGIAVLALAVFIGIKIYLGRVPRIQEKDTIPPSSETFETTSGAGEDTIKPDEVDWGKVYQDVMKDSDIKNILLIGNDGRPGESSGTRSDSIILCSINKKTGKITLVSFMRDMYVPISGYSDNRINASYTFGGAKLLKSTIEGDFGIAIDNCVEINFDGFIKAMTAVGNLEIELTEAEADYLNEMGNAMNKEEGLPESEWNLKPGKNLLKPEQALAYSRTRYVGRSDWERTERQRRVISAAFNRISALGVSDQIDLVNSILPYIATDMTDMEILGYVYYVATENIRMGESYRVPADGAYRNETINQMMVLVPDLEKNSGLLSEWLYQGIR